MQIFPYISKEIPSPMSNGQNFVNVVKEWPTTALPKGQRGRWKIRIRERERKKNLFFCVTFYYCVCESPIVVQAVKSLILFYFFCKESIVKESAAEQSHETKGKRTLALVWTFKNDY
jgi:hypothetical protein